MIKPAISIIVPIYNAESYFERCLNSICAQTLTNIEIICINDASNDKSLDIINSFQKRDDRIRCINLQSNVGESKARNIGIDNAKGEYIGSVDNDDYVDIDFFESLYTKAAEGNFDIVKGNCIETNGEKVKIYTENNIKILKDKINFFFLWWTAIYRLEFLNINNIRFPENILGGDLVFLCKSVIKSNSLYVLNSPFYHYCRRSDSGDSSILSLEKINSVLQVYKDITNIYDDIVGYCISQNLYVQKYQDIIVNILFDIAQRCESPDALKRSIECSKFLIKKCKRRECLIKKLETEYPLLSSCIDSISVKGVLSCYHKKRQKIFCGKLRKNLSFCKK